MPDVHRPEVRAIGVGVADAIDDGYFALVPQRFDRPHVRVETKMIVYGEHILCIEVDIGPEIVVEAVAIGDNCVETVVCSGKLHHH